ncbi:MAG: aminotransferase class I/II-fold pyridoxal phosphate-dependent enzyme [Flavobacteriales bacterium]|nr:aminotransferase class I/II-fold pyridoxal phosphate-dependent enzyme [Flavobacteriales bacterium]
MWIDLRSDTVTKPGKEMLEAMFSAKVGDDVFGDDPTVNLLEEKVAKYFGKESALFFPSGTMANQVAVKSHTQLADEIICDQTSHVYKYEGGGLSANSGVSVRLLQGKRGIFTGNEVKNNINSDDVHFPATSAVVIENTVNKGGGICWKDEEILDVQKVCKEHHLALHLDGARLWNAMVSKKQDPLYFGKWFDTISVCFSKGLGCPVGSVLVGNREIISKARRHRKRMGGGMRQAGILAAACIYALENNISRLEFDHLKANTIYSIIPQLSRVVDSMQVETNILLFKLSSADEANQLVSNLLKDQIKCLHTGEGWIRLVFHLDIEDGMMEQLLKSLKKHGN